MYNPKAYTQDMKPKEIQAWRKKNGYSQSQLARVLGVSTLSVSRWECGTRGTSKFLHLALAHVEGMAKEKTKRRR